MGCETTPELVVEVHIKAPKCALYVGYHGHALLIFTHEVRSRLRALRSGLVVEVPKAEYQKLT
jgi:hypothetical protein